jgi:small subunit ribosomal protein S21
VSRQRENIAKRLKTKRESGETLAKTMVEIGGLARIIVKSHLGGFGGVFPLAEIRVQEGEPLENALRRFKRKVQTEDIIKEVKRHSFYLKPGEKKRVKEALARKRNRKKVRKEQD